MNTVTTTKNNTITIEYWNDANVAQMYYQTGIINKMIHDAILTNYKPDGRQDVHLGDSRAILVDSSLNNSYELTIFEVTTAIAVQIAIAMSHKYIKINGIMYVANEKVDAQKIGEHTNLYNIKVSLIEAGDLTYEDVELPKITTELIGILKANDIYIKL